MDYIKIDPLIDSDPDMEEAGWCAARVYELLLKVSGAKDLRGVFPPEFQKPSWLAKRWNLTSDDMPDPITFISNGIRKLIEVGKLVIEDGCLVIRGWDKFYKPAKTNTERQADFREKRKVTEPTNSNEAPLPSNGCNESNESNATPHTPPTHSTSPTKQHCSEKPNDDDEKDFKLSSEPKTIPRKPSEAEQFFESVQEDRVKRGRCVKEVLSESELPKLNAWFKQALTDAGGLQPLSQAWFNFVKNDAHWRKEDFPFRAFMKFWRKHAPPIPENAQVLQ